jgi:capsular exopolysaccharide synthesis family protein
MNDLGPQHDYRQSADALDLGEEGDAFTPPARSAFDLRYIAASIRANLLMIAGIVLLALALAVVATLLDTPRYSAIATIQINDASNRVIGEDDDQTQAVSNLYDTDRFLKTQTDVLKSRGLSVRVAQKLKLFGNAGFYRAMEADAPSSAASQEAVRNQTLGLLRNNLTVTLPRDSRIVTIAFNSADQNTAADIANAFATEFIQSNLQRRYDSTAYAREFVGAQLADAKLKLETSERELNDYARSAGIIRTNDAAEIKGESGAVGGGSITTASLVQLNAAANEAQAARIAAEGRWRAVSSGPPLASREVLSNPTVVSLANQRAALEAALQDDLTRHLDDYPSVRQKRAELAELTSELQAAAQAVRSSLLSEYRTALETERRLNAKVKALKGETLSEQDRSVRYAILEREADTNRQLYDGLLQRYKELTASSGISASNVSIIDQAEIPSSPSSPNLIKNLLIALIAGVGLAGLALFVKDQLDDAIRVPEDIEHKLRLPLLGVVPKVSGRDPARELGDPKSPVSEAYNSLRGALLYSTSQGLPQVILVTSAQPGEGKTTTSHALAAGFARMGRKALLVDADLRRPSVHRNLGSNNEQGLTTLLAGHRSLAEIAEQSEQNLLSMLTSGPVPPSPTELLSSTRMEQLLEEMARTYDVVIIDSPPILGLADAPVLSALVDGVVFVVESDRSRRGSLKMALRRLRAMRPVLLGAVLTKFDPTREGNRYSEYYGYHYYQYDHRDPEPA